MSKLHSTIRVLDEILARWASRFTFNQAAVNASLSLIWPILYFLTVNAMLASDPTMAGSQALEYWARISEGMMYLHMALFAHLEYLVIGVISLIREYQSGEGIKYGTRA